ncbi:Sec-independent protein translocase protein TatB [Psychrobacter sp. HD31]|uniref:Sec-independent protein translocase protein TatB n=1 Tax=Psychrobacter sp. HD31 TaxID=3112003 RepID=UPI003DA1E64F
MFDIGFSEILVFGAIALIVLGPEKLPQAARTAGKWYSKARRTMANLQAELENELDLAETRKQMQAELTKIREAEANMQKELREMRGNMQKLQEEQNQELAQTKQADTHHD